MKMKWKQYKNTKQYKKIAKQCSTRIIGEMVHTEYLEPFCIFDIFLEIEKYCSIGFIW